MVWIRTFGGLAIQVVLILFGALSILVFARDGFQVFLHEAFNWLIVMADSILGAIFNQPGIQRAIEAFLRGLQSWLAGVGISVDLVLQPHWKHAFVLLSLAFTGYAHAFKDFDAQPATSLFRYVNAVVCAFLGGLMAGTVHLAHTGVLAWPLAAFALFLGLGALWRSVVQARGLRARGVCVVGAVVLFVIAGLIAHYVLGLENTNILPGQSPSPGLVLIAIAVALMGIVATIFGFGGKRAAAAQGHAEPAAPQWLDNPGRKMGLRVLATLGVSASIAGLGQASWELTREPASAVAAEPGELFRDCPDCPEMALIPAGSFMMGTTDAQKVELQAAGAWIDGWFDTEQPVREIAVPAFALARTEVTLKQFQDFIDATGYRPSGVCWGPQQGAFRFRERVNWRDPGYAQGPDHPVVCVTWWDAQAYARWLSLRTGQSYRLPTEAEWEYAARAGARTHYHWGDDADLGCAFMNGADQTALGAYPDWPAVACEDGAVHTAPVGSYQPNPFGLSDMTGNVFEWVEDCYGPYDPARADSAAATQRWCSHRVARGGSWNHPAGILRPAVRYRSATTFRSSGFGFRLARSVAEPGA